MAVLLNTGDRDNGEETDMTFEKANELVQDNDPRNWGGGLKAFGCVYFHNICISCVHKEECIRKEPLIEKCNFYFEANHNEAEEKEK